MSNREHNRLRPQVECSDENHVLNSEPIIFNVINGLNAVIASLHEVYATPVDLTDLILFTLIKRYMASENVPRITKGQVYIEGVLPFWRISYPTFNKRFNKLVRFHFFNPLGFRGSGGKGYSEAYVPTIKQRLLDIKLNETIG